MSSAATYQLYRVTVGDIALSVRDWPGQEPAFLLLHGLASNSLLWAGVAERLAAAGHRAVAVDQRGHGLSDKPDGAYDFSVFVQDLNRLIDALKLTQPPIIAGQSWGGNVVLAFGAEHPQRARGLAFIDGGFLNLRGDLANDWETVAERLRPPQLTGIRPELLLERIKAGHPDWSPEAAESVLGNFAVQADGGLRANLTLERHMLIVRAMWEQDPLSLYPRVTAPVLICPAARRSPEDQARSQRMVAAAEAALPRSRTEWFHDTDHDIHAHRPDALAELFLRELNTGLWAG